MVLRDRAKEFEVNLNEEMEWVKVKNFVGNVLGKIQGFYSISGL